MFVLLDDEIKEGRIDFDSQPWPCISSGAKYLIKQMLNKKQKERISAANVLGKPLSFVIFILGLCEA